MDILASIASIGPPIWDTFKPYLDMKKSRDKLRELLVELGTVSSSIVNNLLGQENNARRRRKCEVIAYLRIINDFIQIANRNLDVSERDMITRAQYVGKIKDHLDEAAKHLSKGEKLLNSGLTYTTARMRGDILPVRELELMGETASRKLNSTLEAIYNGGKNKIGIYGCPGAGKKSLMKHVYNRVLRDYPDFKGVFWAEAPEIPGNNFTLQEVVSEGMWFDFENDTDCVRRASMLEDRLRQVADSGGRGRVIFFMCNLKQDFRAYEVLGISHPHCVFVFTAPSLDVCNRMQCDLTIKMDHLTPEEAEELFIREAGLPEGSSGDNPPFWNPEQEIKNLAIQIARECARMPLAIRVIANSMREIKDIREWRNRLTELVGRITAINNDEDKILEQLKFAYFYLEDPTTRNCFEVAAQVLVNDAMVPKERILAAWRSQNLIGTDIYSNDQGHTVLNQLQRLCLLEVEIVGPSLQLVTMNKWIRKMAAAVRGRPQIL